jgi:hypothetical protein
MALPGVEVLLSVLRNADFGPVLAIGRGGTATELEADVAYVALPTTAGRIEQALASLKLAALLRGFRGAPPADVPALVAAACALGERFVATQPHVAEFEVNPLFVHDKGGGVTAVDALFKP